MTGSRMRVPGTEPQLCCYDSYRAARMLRSCCGQGKDLIGGCL